MSRYGSRVSGLRVTREGRARRSLLLAPGTAFTTTALLSLFVHMTIVGWIILIVGLVFLLAFAQAERRGRRRAGAATSGPVP